MLFPHSVLFPPVLSLRNAASLCYLKPVDSWVAFQSCPPLRNIEISIGEVAVITHLNEKVPGTVVMARVF